VQKKAEDYLASLEKQNLPEQEKEDLMEKKMYELLGTLGMTLTAEQKKLLADEEAAAKIRDQKANVYNCAFGKLQLIPAKVKVDVPDGWKEEQRDEDRDRANGVVRRDLSKSLKTTASDGSTMMSASASVNITLGTDEKMVKAYQQDTKGLQGAYSTITIGGFRGDSFESNAESPGTGIVNRFGTRDYLLKQGGLYVRIQVSINATGYRITDSKGNVIGDGRSSALSSASTLASEAQGITTSFRLLPGKVPAKK
jgi:hypothetical protein